MLYAAFLKLSPLALVAYWSVQAQAAEEDRGRWWLWLLLLVVASAFVAWLLGRESSQRTPARSTPTARPAHDPPTPAPMPPSTVRQSPPVKPVSPEPPIRDPAPEPIVAADKDATDKGAVVNAESPGNSPPATAPLAQAAPAQPDDLTRIEGIGPKIRTVLQAAGIQTFADLAGADVGRLKQILVEAGLRIHNPATWPQQAVLAQSGQWDELKTLQTQLSAGRRN